MVKAIALYTRSHHVWPWHLANLQKTRKGSYVYLILNTSKFYLYSLFSSALLPLCGECVVLPVILISITKDLVVLKSF